MAVMRLKPATVETAVKGARKMRKLFLVLCVTIATVTAGASAMASEIAKFYGVFEGSGISENADSLYFAVSVRDMNVTIRPADNGAFTLSWVTITREGGDPNAPDEKRKETVMTFSPTEVPGVYRGPSGGDPLFGGSLWWSRVEGNTLHTYMMRVEEDGTWQVQNYARTVGPEGMSLNFQRIIDGSEIRHVRGRLVKTGN